MRRQLTYASIAFSLLMFSVQTGCRCPDWWAYRSMRCVPDSSDRTARAYWEECQRKLGKSPLPSASASETPSSAPGASMQAPSTEPTAGGVPATQGVISTAPAIRLASHQQLSQSNSEPPAIKPKQLDPLRLPLELPGAETPALTLPRVKPDGGKLDPETQKANILQLYPALSPLPIEQDALPNEMLSSMGLEELQHLARENHPGLRAAIASVEAARGQMIQAGLPPNPNLGYQADTVRTSNTLGYQGAYLQQTFITARKLGLAAQAAAVDYANAQVNQRKTWVTVQSSVRRSYFQVLAARKRLVLAKALAELSEQAYQAQIKLVVAGEAAPYEPLQLKVLTTQARAAFIRAQQDSIAAWRTLSAAVGIPTMPASPIEGRIDCSVPELSYDSALAQMTAVHTDLRIAENLIAKNRTLVTLADRKPIPDLNVGFVVQKDYTFQPGTETYNLTVGGAVPVFDRNQGNRIATRAELVRVSQLVADTENQLIGRLATSYGIYKSNRQLADSFRTDALSDQVRAYRGIYQRYLTDSTGISFNDVIVAQQTVAGVLNQYIEILQAQWQSTVDLGELLQVDDLFAMGDVVEVAEIPEL